jgi:glycosyltransferase involved in cell wall biosynthesis
MLIEAYRRSTSTWPLVLSMPAPEGAPHGVRGVGGLSDGDATVLLQAAGAVCFPSLYEGFGLPPVEAICAGAPLLVSDIPPHREGLQDIVDGECAWLEPKHIDAWAEALKAAQRGMKPASHESRSRVLRRYSIERLGQSMDRIYRGVLGV